MNSKNFQPNGWCKWSKGKEEETKEEKGGENET